MTKGTIYSIALGLIIGGIITAVAVTHRTPKSTYIPTPEPHTQIVVIETKSPAQVVTEAHTEVATEPTFKPYDTIPLTAELQADIYKSCEKYNICYELALAIIKTESEFTVDAVGDNGQATGLCQIWSYWWDDLANERGLDINKPADNVELMLIILNQNLIRCNGDLTGALQMYNTGKPDGNEYAQKVYNNLDIILNEVDYYD